MALPWLRRTFPAIAVTLLPALLLLPAAPVQPDEPPVILRLCRTAVTPCQQEINLPVGGQASIDVIIQFPSAPVTGGNISLNAWYLALSLNDVHIVNFSPDPATGLPFQEQGRPELALEGWQLLDSSTSNSDPPHQAYYRFRNGHDPTTNTLEYGVILVGTGQGVAESPAIPISPGETVLIAQLLVTATAEGNAELFPSGPSPISPSLVITDARGRHNTLDLATETPLFRINVGPTTEKARLEGHVWTEIPGNDNARIPFTRELAVTVWPADTTPHWQGGDGLPLAEFSNVIPDTNGRFTIPDLPADIIPPGTYDLRVSSPGILTALVQGVQIDTIGNDSEVLPEVVEVDFGPLTFGDLSGDNQIDAADLEFVKLAFGSMAGVSNFQLAGDINSDGVVDAQDFSLLAANFGRQGE